MKPALHSGMCIEIAGEGDAVVMLHGLGGTSNTWQPLMPVLEGMQVIRPDLPGAGRSPVPDGSVDVAMIVSSLLRALASLGVEAFHLVGHSFGTLVAQHLAMAKPAAVRTLTLFGPIIEPADPARERLRARADLARTQGMETVADQVTPAGMAGNAAEDNPAAFAFVRESHMRQPREGFAKSCEALAGAHRADPASLVMPALIVTGELDAISPPGSAYQLADELPSARAVILGNCGHWATLERPDDCKRLVREFIRETTH